MAAAAGGEAAHRLATLEATLDDVAGGDVAGDDVQGAETSGSLDSHDTQPVYSLELEAAGLAVYVVNGVLAMD